MTPRRRFLKIAAAGTAIGGALAAGWYAFLHSARFGRLPQGKRRERILLSPNFRNGAFRNLPTAYRPPFRPDDGRGGVWSALFRKRALRLVPKEGDIAVVKSDLLSLDRTRDMFVWFGHSSYLLQTDGARILVDPVFGTASPISFLLGEPFPGTNIYTPNDIPEIDVLVITHDHWDHLDYSTVTALRNRIGRIVCPLGVGEHFERWGFDPEMLIELDWGEAAELPCADGRNIVFHCLPTLHFSGRGFVRNQSLWASFLVEAPSRKVYFGGDGGYDERFKRIGARFPNIDLAFLENGQYNLRWPRVHTLPDELAKAMLNLGARRYMTGHHGKFCISTHPWDEPYANEKAAAAVAGANLIVPRIGEIVPLAESTTKKENNFLTL
jgi:L-ascorbate metabolism protein UlaG (beta-lactamase superfamily)